ncbi:prenyltransferase/squalene oxidase repeat-containing protein [Roseiconus lacunae]|uniref:prenyltransferase/squalene oxidase repeat-containing protein n=1 Tax=Roseiconus lacunae TaxID=2605694 RepID=UPI001E41F418|nr:prenyltransferase/squalene oxidase repeat-containing protein [Roseiconus lacunae]MCD0461792.1 terpene cyclase/mutase family protein [Roseiconus lacunae]
MSRFRVTAAVLLASLATSAVPDLPLAAESSISLDSPEAINAAVDQAANRGIEFLKNRGQGANGAFSPETGVAITSICVRAILDHHPGDVNSPSVKKAIDFITERVKPDGGIYGEGSKHRNYETSVAIGALVKANKDDRFDSELKRAEAFLKDIQWDEGEGIDASDPAYGGAGYGSHSRPDLSNTTFMLDALKDLGNEADDEAVQKALRFISRTQNLVGHGNDTEHADKINDGGFYYTPAAGGQSKVVVPEGDDGGGLRSYGSMTYAGLKSMIYAGLTSDDPRVAAAMDFIQKNYSLADNPGMGKSGLYYYYHTFAKALDAAEIRVLTDAKGVNHNWKRELTATLLAAQQEDGSWVNSGSTRWMEGDRNLVTAYALLALKYCRE